jgi:hypothetical protein
MPRFSLPAWQDLLLAAVVAVLATLVFLPGLKWGLPNAKLADQCFPAGKTPWTGAQILKLTPGWGTPKAPATPAPTATPAADVDRDPAASAWLNETDAQRAQIVMRYRLYSHQPDEMLTFRAMAGMLPGSLRLDPRMYHYGGLWIYPVGGLIKVADFADLVTVSHDLSIYLDHPALFADFYIVARCYTLLFVALGAVAAFTLARVMGVGRVWAVLTAALWCATPAVIAFGHEAKPHLPALSLSLWCITAAAAGRWKTSATFAGLAAAMLPSAGVVVLVPITYVVLWHAPWCTCNHLLLRRDSVWRTLAVVAIAVGVYLLLNPYVLLNLPTALSNSANVASAYGLASPLAVVAAAAWKLSEATSRLTLIAATCALAAILYWRRHEQMRPLAGLLALTAPAALTATIVAAIFTANSPPDTARFFLLPSAIAVLMLMLTAATLMPQWWKRGLLLVLVATPQLVHSGAYLRAFLADTHPTTTRAVAAEQINRAIREQGVTTVIVPNDLAPYAVPPINLWDAKILLKTPGTTPTPNDAEIVAPPFHSVTPMTHASRLFLVRMNGVSPPQ